MTQSQQKIIDSLKLEFEKINIKKSYGGNLIDIDGILGDIEKDKNTLLEIKLNNEYQTKVLNQRILDDVDILNEDLKKIGFIASNGSYGFNRLSIKDLKNNTGIDIDYEMSTTYKSLTNDNQYQFYKGFECLSSYARNPNSKTRYVDLKSLTSSPEFKSAIRRLYETS
jgi:hypothetical protein